MGCNCGTKRAAKETFKVTHADGTTKTVNSEIEAKAAIARKGGSYKKQ
jgi:VCBS repeat-containing protein